MFANEFERVAYHESAHALFGYFNGYTVDFIKLNKETPGLAVTKFNFYTDYPIIHFLKYPEDFHSQFNVLEDDKKGLLLKVAYAIIEITLAGSCSEYYYQTKIKNNNYACIVDGPDLEDINRIKNTLTNLKIAFSDNIDEDIFNSVYDKMSITRNWITIDSLAKNLLQKEDLFLNKLEIEKVLLDLFF